MIIVPVRQIKFRARHAQLWQVVLSPNGVCRSYQCLTGFAKLWRMTYFMCISINNFSCAHLTDAQTQKGLTENDSEIRVNHG